MSGQLESKGDSAVIVIPNQQHWQSEIKRSTRLGTGSNRIAESQPNSAPSATNYTTGQKLQWTLNVDAGSIVDSAPEVSATFEIRLTSTVALGATTAAAIEALQDKLGFAPMPINRLIDNASVQFNGTVTLDTPVADLVGPQLYQYDQNDLRFLGSASQPDNALSFSSTTSGNVLKNIADGVNTRGLGTSQIQSIGVDTDRKVVDIVIKHQERLMARPFQYFDRDSSDFIGVKSLRIALTLGSDFKRAVNEVIDNTTVTYVNVRDMTLKFKSYTPLGHAKMDIPPVIKWKMPQFDLMQSTTVTVPTGAGYGAVAPVLVNIASAQREVVAKQYAIYALAKSADPSIPDRYLPIQRVQFGIGNKQNSFDTHTTMDLFNVSRANGYNGSSNQFMSMPPGVGAGMAGNGCVLFFTPSDLETDSFVQSQVRITHQISARVYVCNPTGANLTNVVVYLLSFTQSSLIMNQGLWEEELEKVEPIEIQNGLETQFRKTVFDDNALIGAGFWDTLKNVITSPVTKAITKMVRNNVPLLQQYAGDNTTLGKVATRFGYGEPAAGGPQGGSIMRLGGSAPYVEGGRNMSVRDLVREMREKY